jgi:hypothetical protein
MARKQKPPPEPEPDPLAWLEDDEAWDGLKRTFSDDGPLSAAEGLAANLALCIKAIETGQSDRAVAAMKRGIHACWPYTLECSLAERLWTHSLSETVPLDAEPIHILTAALDRCGVNIKEEPKR